MKIIPIDTQIAIRWLQEESTGSNFTRMTQWLKRFCGFTFNPDGNDLRYIYDVTSKYFVELITGCDTPGKFTQMFLNKMTANKNRDDANRCVFDAEMFVLLNCPYQDKSKNYINGFTPIADERLEYYFSSK